MMVSPLSALLLLVWSGLAAADQRALGGRQLHQPLVAAVVAGWILGDPGRGLLVGAWFQLIWTVPLPVGGALLPDTGSAAVAATILAVLFPVDGGLLLAILVGLLVARVSIPWESWLRAMNQSRAEASAREARPPAERLVLIGLLGPFARGVLVAAGTLALSETFLRLGGKLLARIGSLDLALTTAVIGGAAAIGFASLVDRFRIEAGSRGGRWILGGVVLGAVLRLFVGMRP